MHIHIPQIPEGNKAREVMFHAGRVPDLKTFPAKNGIRMLFPSLPPDLSWAGHAKVSTVVLDAPKDPTQADPKSIYGIGNNIFFKNGFNWPLPKRAIWRRFWAWLLKVLIGAVWGHYCLRIAPCPLDWKQSLFIDYDVDDNKSWRPRRRDRLVGWFSSHIRDYVRVVKDADGNDCLLGRFCLEIRGKQYFFGWFLMIPLKS